MEKSPIGQLLLAVQAWQEMQDPSML